MRHRRVGLEVCGSRDPAPLPREVGYVGNEHGVRCLDIVPQVGAAGERMKAAVHDRYGPPEVMRLEDVERPAPKDDEVLVRVCASTVTRSDTALRSAEYWFTRAFTGLRWPKQRIAGMELAGIIEAAGTAVTRFQVGDEVFGIRSGANAEYVCVRERGVLAHKPADITFEEAAAVPDGACTALAFLRQAGLEQSQRLLVYGASGSIGTAAVQLGRHFGANVTAVCDARHQELVRSLGAGTVIDYRREDFTANGLTYDIILDAVGKLSAWRSRRSLKPGGVYLTAGSAGSLLGVLVLSLLTRLVGSRRIKLGMAEYRGEDLRFLKELIDRGGYRAVIDRSYPLEDVVEAHRYVDTHQKTGNVVLTVRNDCAT
jgi:NADPH:quinone reductase-like Zn-dependent oxidoreductase